ncbi:uncharacterized protein FIBRA_01449 [Fibroporia radiculosa]|uniref:DUF6533 domain-containing protein n=1 Tax=Fibroporia radiculosa TaxID=599839 RepID=J4I8H7_9APHY|nr:uncharacterized protein FIBRA_01449 [Fibroporia radiculosa]CCL99431.1 predicted protein [Fibroporia radiculosa]
MENNHQAWSMQPVDKIQYMTAAQSVRAMESSVAALCFLVWDICLTTDLEVTHIWLTPWAPSKLPYLFTRYYSLIALIVLRIYKMTCRQWIVFEGVSAFVLEIAVELMLILRLYAMYVGSKYMVWVMLVPFAVQCVVMVVSLGLSIPRIMTSADCVEAFLPVEMVVYCATSILYETFLFGLTVGRYIKARRAGWGNVELLKVLFRDGMLAFVVIIAAMSINTILFTLAPRSLAAIGFPWLLAILGSVGPRLVLNVRAVNDKHIPPSSLEDMSTLQFDMVTYRALDAVDPDSLAESDEENQPASTSSQNDHDDAPHEQSDV